LLFIGLGIAFLRNQFTHISIRALEKSLFLVYRELWCFSDEFKGPFQFIEVG